MKGAYLGEGPVQQVAKQFADALNKSLDELSVPTNIKERASILGRMLQIPKQQAWALLEGHLSPDDELLRQMATEIELDITPFLQDK